MATYTKYNCFVENLAEKVHNLGADTLKVALSNTAPNVSTHAVLADVTEISAGNGYSAGGTAVTVTGSSQTAGTYSLTQTADVVFTASGAVGPFRYAILYNDTPTSPADPLIAYWDYGSSISLATGETFTVDMAANILTIA
jgi:hypothetical protein